MAENRKKLYSALYHIALAAGAAAAGFYALFLISEAVACLFEGKTGVIPILLMMTAAVFGYLLVFKRRKPGAVIMCLAAIAMAIYLLIAGGWEGYKMALTFSFPFLLPGIILYKILPSGQMDERVEET